MSSVTSCSPSSAEFSPLTHDAYFDTVNTVEIDNSKFLVYSSNFSNNESKETFVFIHGAAFSALSFALCSKALTSLSPNSSVLSIDLRGHGGSSSDDETELSMDILSADVIAVLNKLFRDRVSSRVFLVGHSLGGSVATHVCASFSSNTDSSIQVHGLVVLDCIEEVALSSLAGVELTVNSMPPSFETPNHAIAYMFCSDQIHHLESCRVSVPPRIVERASGDFVWRTDLLRSKEHWVGWFKGFTTLFLAQPCSKLVCVSNPNLLDPPMMMAQMQGKFEFRCMPNCGHHIQEDDPVEVARMLLVFSSSSRTM